MEKMTLSFLGLYNYNQNLFDLFNLPDGVIRTTVINRILAESSDLELIYPDWETCYFMLQLFSLSNLDRWTKLYNTTQLEYNPIENYDRAEEWTDTGTGEQTYSNTGSGESTSHSTGSGDTNTTNSAIAFNSAAYKDTSHSHGDNSTTTDGTGTSSSTDSGNSQTTGKTVHTGRVHGNIGVTTSQQMIESERQLQEFCIEDLIVEETIRYFCILVY